MSQHAIDTSVKRNSKGVAGPSSTAGKPQHRQKHSSPSHSESSRRSSPTRIPERVPFTRSRSPAVHTLGNSFGLPPRPASPAVGTRSRQSAPLRLRTLLPGAVNIVFSIPFSKPRWMVTVDVRQATENLLLLCSLGYCADKIRALAGEPFSADMWISIELSLLIIASIIYYCITRLAWSKVIVPAPSSSYSGRPASPRSSEVRRGAPLITTSLNKKEERGLLWMTVPKNYRDAADDGILTGLLGGPFVASALLWLAMRSVGDLGATGMPPNWLIEPPKVLSTKEGSLNAAQAVLISRRNLVSLSTLCSTILIVHVCASRVTEARHRRKVQVPAGELHHVPRKESRRSYLYVLFTISVTLWVLCVKIVLAEVKLGIWQNLSNTEMAAAAMFYQFTLYSAIRLAHHGFTLGELGLVSFGATSLFMEVMNLTMARIWPSSTPFIKTYRLPTPLLIYQLALIPGSLLTGFLLSPLLYLSRHIARRPVRRLRFPEEKQKHRRLLALGFYAGAVLVVGGLIAMWTRWCLGNRDPWVWAMFWLLEGKTKWTRPALLAYWAALGCVSVAGWNRQLSRSRRYRHRPMGSIASETGATTTGFDPSRAHGAPTQIQSGSGPGSDPSAPPTPVADSAGPLGLSFPNLPNLPNLPQLANGATVATDFLDAADKHVPTLSVNARRKFFHVLAVAMFVPGVAVDPAFAHLAFSSAFALFTFAEYVRYFALYPFGAAVHVFMNEFLDSKDSGTAILSHFYLLTGCANSVWFEGPSRLLLFTGILALGVGDALASIVGKRLGYHRWSTNTPKTIEGSAAFAVSVVLCAWLLQICGFTESFSVVRYGAVVTLASVLEAFSVQNDNLTLPLYMWSMLAFVDA